MIPLIAANTAPSTLQVGDPGAQSASATQNRRPDDGVTVNLSMSGNVMDAVDNMFNLGQHSGSGTNKLSREEQDQALKIAGELLKNGYIGYEWLRVGNKIERHDVVMEIGDDRLRNARPYREPVKHTSFKA